MSAASAKARRLVHRLTACRRTLATAESCTGGLIAKLITFLFEKFGIQTYCAILGLIIASPFAIFYNTGLFSQLSSLTIGSVILGVVLAAAGAVLTLKMGEA